MAARQEATRALLELSHQLGREDRGLAILGEGNTSARCSADTFLVKASGASLATLRRKDLVECRFEPLRAALDKSGLTDADVEQLLQRCRLRSDAPKPSVETILHAWLLNLPEVNFVGHTHGTAICSVLCSTRAREFVERWMFPEHGVGRGAASVFVPYATPGLALARAVREQVKAFLGRHGQPPRLVLMENHGVIAVGRTADAVLAATLMVEKAARVYLGAVVLGGVRFFSTEQAQVCPPSRGDCAPQRCRKRLC